MSNLLEIDSLVTSFPTKKGMADAVRGVTLRVKKGKTTVILGESGSGKSVMLRSILRLTQRGSNIAGSVKLEGEELLDKSPKEMVAIRGNRVAMIFQDALSALDPLYRVGDQLKETIMVHQKVKKSEAKEKVIELFRKVGIPSPEERVRAYPHEMSGGMRQRAVIAMALGCHPELLLADEPTTALDVTIQAQILRLFRELQAEYGMSIVLVTHDIGVAAEMADEIAVMYAGKIVEFGPAEEVLTRPMHPYTAGLIAATPQSKQKGRLSTITGQPPLITEMPHGCAFAQRCPYAESRCTESVPGYVSTGRSQQAACFQLAGRERYAQ
ncbi:ABC transporter ATP-binding protein [Paenibacillus sp. XY044]|uniref:ABC transporter ATP-binding protein n=1 Tax=Paenibacillus sp. XY044 TaxID=2026089 RepID=UPI000B99D056|nr:ABC transporter ATP-binding protein [Paenibacillus sp. XY044]OZB94968.1 dipeptide ABC transporter ATP-binding protein DppD [Paenibacillus sp. XY044]